MKLTGVWSFTARIKWALILLIPVIVMMRLSAQPARDRILDEVSITEVAGQIAILVEFPCPLRYRSHFPINRGDELRVRVDPLPLCKGDQDALLQRESIRPLHADVADLIDVVYAGNQPEGPTITFSFNHPVDYKVMPGSDFRSLMVILQATDNNRDNNSQIQKPDSESAQ